VIRGPAWLAAVVLLASGCVLPGIGDDDVDPADAEEQLLAQRDATAETARTLVDGTRDALGGEVLETQGGWEGCTSKFPEGYEDFQYVASVRLQAAPGTPEVVIDELERVAEDSGYETTGAADDEVVVTDGDISAVLEDIPDLGAEGDVLIQLVAEPCVEVPSDAWQDWMRRDDPGPDVG
jgi:hypothetical protein